MAFRDYGDRFDTLGNLRKTAQGGQYRYFMHSSLGRLMFAKQVEQDANSNFSGSGYTDPITSHNQWSVKYLYDDNGNIISTTDAKNVTTTASYDSINRLKVRDYSDSTPDVSFYYDGKGLSSVPDYSNGKTTKITSSVSENRYLTFDIFGHNLTARQTTASVNYDTAYTYNLSGALIEETYPSGRVVKNTIDSDGALSAVETKPAGGSYSARVNTFVYNSAGAATSFKFGNNRFENFAYNDRQQVTQIGLGTSSTDTSLLKLEYKYNTVGNTDNNGSMLEQKITVPTVGGSSGFTATQTYAYDGLNRLTSATETISSTQTWKQEFSYDRYGNKNFVTGSGHTTTLGACPAAQCNPSFNTATNRFSSGQGYTYDANGSLTVDATGQQYTLDAENRQTVLKDGLGNNLAEYTYDGEGKRVRKLIWSSGVVTHFVYDAGGTLIEEWTTTPAPEGTKDKPSVSTTSYVYAGSRLISTETGSGTTYVTVDHLGSTRVTTDGGGNVTSRKDFMAFGEEAITPERNVGVGYGIPPVRQDYTGYEKEAESGLEFAQARFQNPVHGRFTSVDPLTASATIKNPQTFNRYTYALNSPYKFTDPLGLLPNSSGGCSAEYSSCDENGNGKNVDEHADRIYQTQIARIEAQQAFAHGDIERGWQIIRESDGELMALDRNGNAVPDPNEPTVTITATVNPPDDDIPGNENVGITIVVWDAVIGLSTRILGHVSYIIDEKSYSFDASGYHPQDIGEYLNESLKISGATFYILDFGSKALNDKFKDLIKGEYTGDYSTYTGFNNCSSAFARSINAMRNELGTWTIRNTPAGVKKFITGSLSKYKFGQYRKEKLSP
ncbi:MAG: RHS repeat-associated core domain-containing protein [Acidobacteria bacterium ACB1]|nr:RHS repeat-associated core domain-containing protein [Acidobacteria bacterium ACB1]